MMNLNDKKGISLIVLIITIVAAIVIAAIVIPELTGEEGAIWVARETKFRTELASIKETTHTYIMTEDYKNYIKDIPAQDASSWKDTLKAEITLFRNFNKTEEEKAGATFENSITQNEEGKIRNMYYVEDEDLGTKKFIYDRKTDIVYKIASTRIEKDRVHSIEGLDYAREIAISLPVDRIPVDVIEEPIDEPSGETPPVNPETPPEEIPPEDLPIREDLNPVYDPGAILVNDVQHYEPNLNGIVADSIKLIFYKVVNNQPTDDVYEMTAAEWNNRNRINEMMINSDKYVFYDYSHQIWANIKLISDTVETNWVWIPRYAVKVNQKNSGKSDLTTNVIFVDTADKQFDGSLIPNEYTVAWSFQGNTKKGMWVSKYEPVEYFKQVVIQNVTLTPDVSGLDPNNTYLQIYDKAQDRFASEVRLADVSNLEQFARNNLWYDYKNQIWANIKIIKNGVETWWVWIPRYAVYNYEGITEIVFINENNRMSDGKSPSFLFEVAGAFLGNTKRGMWVSKYQPTNQ